MVAGIMGKPHREVYRSMFPGREESEQEALALACYREEEKAIHARGGRLYPGVEAGLKSLAGKFPLFIVSNCQGGYIESFLSWSGLNDRFQDYECHGKTGLPKAGNLARIARRNGLDSPVYIGDTASDQQAALEAGFPFIHAGYGFGDDVPEALRAESFPWLVEYFLGG